MFAVGHDLVFGLITRRVAPAPGRERTPSLEIALQLRSPVKIVIPVRYPPVKTRLDSLVLMAEQRYAGYVDGTAIFELPVIRLPVIISDPGDPAAVILYKTANIVRCPCSGP